MKREREKIDSSDKVNAKLFRTVVHGSEANPLPQKNEQKHTHKWRAYITGINNEELPWIEKVVFHLHESFPDPERAITKPPYEITSTGWGEFDICMTLHFIDPSEAPVDIYHELKLFPPGGKSRNRSNKDPVFNESYEDIVFQNPTRFLYNFLQDHPQTPERPAVKTFSKDKKQKTEDQVNQKDEELNTKFQQAEDTTKAKLKTMITTYKKTLKAISTLQAEIKKLEDDQYKIPR